MLFVAVSPVCTVRVATLYPEVATLCVGITTLYAAVTSHHCMLKLHNYHYVSTMYRPSASLCNCNVLKREVGNHCVWYFMAPSSNILNTSHRSA